jgi:hypothetical protein
MREENEGFSAAGFVTTDENIQPSVLMDDCKFLGSIIS